MVVDRTHGLAEQRLLYWTIRGGGHTCADGVDTCLGRSSDAGAGIPVELSKMSTQLSTVDNCVDNGHFHGQF
jgi:hypothetical protein